VRVHYGVRPEHIRMEVSDKSGGPVARIKVVEPMGSESLIVVDMEGEYVSVLIREDHTFKSGETVRLTPLLDHVHIFDGETGKALRPIPAAA